VCFFFFGGIIFERFESHICVCAGSISTQRTRGVSPAATPPWVFKSQRASPTDSISSNIGTSFLGQVLLVLALFVLLLLLLLLLLAGF
jgi:hypothetical protein